MKNSLTFLIPLVGLTLLAFNFWGPAQKSAVSLARRSPTTEMQLEKNWNNVQLPEEAFQSSCAPSLGVFEDLVNEGALKVVWHFVAVGQRWEGFDAKAPEASDYTRACAGDVVWINLAHSHRWQVEQFGGNEAQGMLSGRVSIGPLCAVEPCPQPPPPDIYSSRELVLQPQSGEPSRIRLHADGTFQAVVAAGTYIVNLADCVFLGCSYALPVTVVIRQDEKTTLEIDIDTGIR